MKLYNTLTKKKEDFKPLNGKTVKFYHCGPTVYWTQHIGNLRAMTMGDLIRRSLEFMGFNVIYVRNYTDVGHLTSDSDEGEDKMEKGARREGLTPEEIADKYIKIFEKDIKLLNLKEPTHKSKATEQIGNIIKMIQILLKKGYAYITPKAIYFDVSKVKDYPAFSTKKLEDEKFGAGKGKVLDPDKKHPADFALWFFKTGAHKNALQYWPSPFRSSEVKNGLGFPGWHIECSVISQTFLGDTLDIHMGGVEHISIHHPNEIAQSESATGKTFSRFWLHNEHLTVNSEKMSKSKGTGYSLSQIIKKGFSPLDLRYFYLTAHYRSKQNFTFKALESAKNARLKLINKLKLLYQSTKKINGKIDKKYLDLLKDSLDDDVNIPKALSILWDMLKDEKLDDATKLDTAIEFDKVFGLELKNKILKNDDVFSHLTESQKKEVQRLIKERQKARENKDYKKADEIRDLLKTRYNFKIIDKKI